MSATTDWVELRDGDDRYRGRLNVRTLTLVLIGRKRDNVVELSRLVTFPQSELHSGALQPQENMIQ